LFVLETINYNIGNNYSTTRLSNVGKVNRFF
jgi:hypothetical protein